MHDLKVAAHDEQGALQTAGDEIYAPRTPGFAAQSCGQTAGPDKTARCLDAHHGYAQTTDSFQPVGGVYLREVLNRSEHGGEDAEEVGPSLSVFGPGVHKEEAQDGDDDGVDDTEGGHDQGGAVGWSKFSLWRIVLIVGRSVIAVAREEDEEEK